jgi:3-hydroxypropanoate dehydrogenase
MAPRLSDSALDQMFRLARTRNGWLDQPVSEEQVRDLYDLLRMGPTSGNCCPARFVWVRSAAGRAKLASLATGNNKLKILAAPVTVIIGYDLDFADLLPELLPAAGENLKKLMQDRELAESTAFRNSSLQGAYLILAARALGLDCGPMSGFDNAAVDREFFAGTRTKSNFICSIGYGSDENLYPRSPRLSFERATRFA